VGKSCSWFIVFIPFWEVGWDVASSLRMVCGLACVRPYGEDRWRDKDKGREKEGRKQYGGGRIEKEKEDEGRRGEEG